MLVYSSLLRELKVYYYIESFTELKSEHSVTRLFGGCSRVRRMDVLTLDYLSINFCDLNTIEYYVVLFRLCMCKVFV